MSHVVMGIDQSLTCTGYVILRDGKVIRGSIRTKPDANYPQFRGHIKRSKHIFNELLKVAQDNGVTHIIFESPALGAKGNAVMSMPLLLGLLLGSFNQRAYSTEILEPKALKKYATGKGNADKQAVYDAIAADNPDFFAQLKTITKAAGKYDIADAYWLAKLYKEKLDASLNCNQD